MYDLPTILALSLAALFAFIGVVQLAGPRFLRDAYRRWDYSQRLRIATGVLDLAAAIMLTDAALLGWGIALGAVLIFGAVVTLLNHRHYACAALATIMMATLIPAALAVPRSDEVGFIAVVQDILADTR
jgi:hypothetical protein